MSENLHVWKSSCLNVFMSECLLDDQVCWKFSWPCAGFWRISARPSFRVEWSVDGRSKLDRSGIPVVDMNTSSTLASHWNGRTEGRTVRPDDPCADSILKLPHFPCPNSLGGNVLLRWPPTPESHGMIHTNLQGPMKLYMNFSWISSSGQVQTWARSGEVWPLQFENDSAIDWRIEFTLGWQCRRYTPLNSIRKSILDFGSGNLSLHS